MNWWLLRRKLHMSWMIALASLGIVLGTAFVPVIHQTWFSSIIWLFVGTGILLLACWKQHFVLIPLAVAGGLSIGAWRGSLEQSHLVIFQKIYGSRAIIQGRVSDDIDIGARGEVTLRVDHLSIDRHTVTGKIWASLTSKADIKRGDAVTIEGKVQPGFGSFSASVYEATLKNVQRPSPGDMARQVRDWFADAVRHVIPEPEASLGIGYLVGQRRALSPDLAQALQIAGLTHVVVASGYNLTILVRLARRLFAKISKYLSTLSASVMILVFVAITGASPSMTRAGLVSGLSLAAWYYGRKFHPLVLLPFAAAITVLINPSYVWGDIGWELSFAAFGGVMIIAPLLQAYFFGEQKAGIIRQILGETVSAQIATLPILVVAFGQLSNVAIIANLLVLPLVPLAMLLTFIAGVCSLMMPVIANLMSIPATWLLHYMTSVAEYFAKLPWAQAEVHLAGWQAGGVYIMLIAVCVYLWRATGHNLRNNNLVE